MSASNVVSIAKAVISKIPSKFKQVYSKTLQTSGVLITNFVNLDPKQIIWNTLHNQTRPITIDQSHLTSIQNAMSNGWGNFPPIGVKYDQTTGTYELISGHHRLQSALNLGLTDIPCFVIDFKSRADGKDPRLEYMQAENAHPSAKPHGERAALKYLNDYKNSGYFDRILPQGLKKEERDKAIKDAANDLLRNHYPNYSPQKRGKWVRKFMQGISPSLIKTWTAKEAQGWFVNNNHLSRLGTFDNIRKQYDIVIQSHTVPWQLTGHLEKELRSQWQAFRKDDEISEKSLKNKLKNLKINVGIYDGNARTFQSLEKNRKETLRELKIINLDKDFTPWCVVDKVKFIWQCTRGPSAEAKEPIVYFWDKNKEEYVLES